MNTMDDCTCCMNRMKVVAAIAGMVVVEMAEAAAVTEGHREAAGFDAGGAGDGWVIVNR
jgi:hypothetical protein